MIIVKNWRPIDLYLYSLLYGILLCLRLLRFTRRNKWLRKTALDGRSRVEGVGERRGGRLEFDFTVFEVAIRVILWFWMFHIFGDADDDR